MRAGKRRRERSRGTAVIELSLMLPWLFFLFAGTLDMGFYSYALIATQNAARVAAEYTAGSSSTAGNYAVTCQYVLAEMSALPNTRTLSGCSAAPLVVTVSRVTGPDGMAASQVTVTYTTVQLVPIPGLTGRVTINRTVQQRVNNVS